MSSVGLVLGGGGITGASYHLGVLLAVELATGWHPRQADVIVGTSCGAAVAAIVRGGALSIDALLGDTPAPRDWTDHLRKHLYPRARPRGLARWARHGLVPGLRRPGWSLVLGSPAPYHTRGIGDWVEELIGDAAHGWPELPTVIVGYDLEARHRVAFGTEASPDVALRVAVSASCAVPLVYEPLFIDGRPYLDGGVASGTSADLLLAAPEPLDLVLVVAPMAADRPRRRAPFYERMLDDAGSTALATELDHIRSEWPDTEIVVLRPDDEVLRTLRPNPLSVEASMPGFLKTLRSMRTELARAEVWDVLERHLVGAAQPRS